jgi:hypothetical protein
MIDRSAGIISSAWRARNTASEGAGRYQRTSGTFRVPSRTLLRSAGLLKPARRSAHHACCRRTETFVQDIRLCTAHAGGHVRKRAKSRAMSNGPKIGDRIVRRDDSG